MTHTRSTTWYGLQNNKFNTKTFWERENKKNLKNLKTIVLFGVILSLLFFAFNYLGFADTTRKPLVNSSEKSSLEQIEDDTFYEDKLLKSTDDYVIKHLKQLGGAYSNIVAMSVSPFTTLTILSGIGTLQNLDINERPDFKIFKDMVAKLPIDLSEFPLANESSFSILLVAFTLCYILRLFSITKLLTMATIDKLEKWFGQIISILFVALTASTTQVYAATTIAAQQDDTSTWLNIVNILISLLAPVASGIIYYFVKTICLCIDVIFFIFNQIPAFKVIVSGVYEGLKSVSSFALTMIALLNPALSIAISIPISILCAYFFKKAYITVTYFKFIYLKPFWNATFYKNKLFPLVWSNVPRKITALFNNIEIALPVFPLKRIRKIGKKEKCWLVCNGEKVYICRNRVFRKPICISLDELVEDGNKVYMQKSFRFLRIFSDEQLTDSYKKLIAVVSREYNNQFEDIIETLGLNNYNELEQARKEARRIQKEENKIVKVQAKQAKKEEMLQKKQDLKIQSIINKQQLKMKQKEFKDNLKRLKAKKPDTLTNSIENQKPLPISNEQLAIIDNIRADLELDISNAMEEAASSTDETFVQ
jgi:hypothetical protein